MPNEMSLEELNRRVSIHIRKIHLMLARKQISSDDTRHIRLASYPIAKRQWKLPPELAHLETIYAATNPDEFVEANRPAPSPPDDDKGTSTTS
ncbi:MAG: hypothetical protein HZC22_06610 [Rhodocyclales bacterium]|nr:hypothetical protein [Rhodocyclales bacterium]